MENDTGIVLSFGDSLLRKSDIALLDPPNWINDSLMGFMMEYFEKIKYKQYEKQISFLHPSICQCIKLMGKEEIGIILDPLNFKSKSLVFIPVNDNKEFDKAGGTHWTLLVFDKPSNTFYHFNSMGIGSQDSKHLKENIEYYLTKSLGIVPLVSLSCPKQTNLHDCGIFVVSFMDYLSKVYSDNGEKINFCKNLFDGLQNNEIFLKRNEIKNIINDIIDNKL